MGRIFLFPLFTYTYLSFNRNVPDKMAFQPLKQTVNVFLN